MSLEDAAVFAQKTQFVTLLEEDEIEIAPPEPGVEFETNVQLVIVSTAVELCETAPPSMAAELPMKMQLVSDEVEPDASTAPPPDVVATLAVKMQFTILEETPSSSMPPPLYAEPLLNVQFVMSG